MKRSLIVVSLLVFAAQFQIGCSKSSPTANSSNASPPAGTPTPVENASPELEEMMATSAAKSSHCGDDPPANPSHCNINQPFQAGCALPWSNGQSHEIDQRCPNEGCAKKDSDKAQNRIKNNVCATGTPIQINVTSIDKLQAAVDKLVQQGQFDYGPSNSPPPADRAKLHGLSTVDANGHSITLERARWLRLMRLCWMQSMMTFSRLGSMAKASTAIILCWSGMTSMSPWDRRRRRSSVRV